MANIQRHSVNHQTWYGLCPDKKGEWCGNHHTSSTKEGENRRHVDMTGWDSHAELPEAPRHYHGKPSGFIGKTSEERAAEGWVGLYLIEDSKPKSDSPTFMNIDTDALTEEVISGQRRAAKPFVPPVPMEQR